MSGKQPKKDAVEVSSQPLQDELVAIKDRLSAIETIQSISNASVVKKYVEEHLKTEKGKAIMKECTEPRTKEHLISQFKFNSPQALDHHLKPLLKDDLLRRRVEDDGTVVFEWSNLFRRLPHSTITSNIERREIARRTELVCGEEHQDHSEASRAQEASNYNA